VDMVPIAYHCTYFCFHLYLIIIYFTSMHVPIMLHTVILMLQIFYIKWLTRVSDWLTDLCGPTNWQRLTDWVQPQSVPTLSAITIFQPFWAWKSCLVTFKSLNPDLHNVCSSFLMTCLFYPKWDLYHPNWDLLWLCQGPTSMEYCKGNLTDLRRILHLSLAKGNPK
jgi:hypothetical protein